jgi:hypothetical protein
MHIRLGMLARGESKGKLAIDVVVIANGRHTDVHDDM